MRALVRLGFDPKLCQTSIVELFQSEAVNAEGHADLPALLSYQHLLLSYSCQK